MADNQGFNESMRDTVDATSDDHPAQAVWLSALGLVFPDASSLPEGLESFVKPYTLDAKLENRRAAITEHQINCSHENPWLSPSGYTPYPWLDDDDPNFAPDRRSGFFAGKLCKDIRAGQDLDESIQVARDRLKEIPSNHPDRADWLYTLGVGLDKRFSQEGKLNDLDEYIKIGQENTYLFLKDRSIQISRADCLNELGTAFKERYIIKGDLVDLDECLRKRYHASLETQMHHDIAKEESDSILGKDLLYRYNRVGRTDDLEEAIDIARKLVNTVSKHTAFQRGCLDALADALYSRYLGAGATADIEESIQLRREVLKITHRGSHKFLIRLSNLGSGLIARHARLGTTDDLDESLRITQKLSAIVPEDPSERPQYLNRFAVALIHKYRQTNAMTDLGKSIKVSREAIKVAKKYQGRTYILKTLGDGLGERYSRLRSTADLDESIQLWQKVVVQTPEHFADRADSLINLGLRLQDKYRTTGCRDHLERALQCFQDALNQSNALISSRINAGQQALQISSSILDWQQAYIDSSAAVKLVTDLAPHSLRRSEKQQLFRQVAGLACDAAAIALQAGKTPAIVLTTLERGRGLLLASFEEIRTDIGVLEEKVSSLAYEFKELCVALESPAPQRTRINFKDHRFFPGSDSRPDKRYLAGKGFGNLIADIRKRPGLESFLSPPGEEDIKAAAQFGPIVVVNVSEYRCDALLVEQHQIRSLALPHLNSKEIKEKAEIGGLGNLKLLEWLWDFVASPILDALGFTQSPSDDNWPHVWWIPTGLLSNLPLHAAGRHGDRSAQTVLDRVMSSYSSSIKAIIDGRRRRISDFTQSARPQALLVAMQDTPKRSTLPSAKNEVAMLRDLFKSMAWDPVEPGRHKSDIMPHLSVCKIFHFAGHGHTDDRDPSQSHLLLRDWETDRLTVADLLQMNIREHLPFLAYLSACGTGRIEDAKFCDESIHLISACQLAGFRHVIGTLWDVDDDLCVEMARITYEGMRDGGMTDESMCRGLHKATRGLRDRWLITQPRASREGRLVEEACVEHAAETRSARDEDRGIDRMPWKMIKSDKPTGPLHWVPYVHFGV